MLLKENENNIIVSLFLDESYEKFKKKYISSILEKKEFIIENTTLLKLIDKRLTELIGNRHELLNQFSNLINLKHPKEYIIHLKRQSYNLLKIDIETVYKYLDNFYHVEFLSSTYRTIKRALDNMYRNDRYFLDVINKHFSEILPIVDSKEENPKNLSLIMLSKDENDFLKKKLRR